MSDFTKAVNYTLGIECGFVDNPLDSGGATNWGITCLELSTFRGHMASTEEVKNLTRDEAISIYEKFYWNFLRLGEVKSDMIATAIFDIAVNRGTSAAARYAQTVAKIHVDSIMGDGSLRAINLLDEDTFIMDFIHVVKRGYVNICRNNATQLEFLDGWLERVLKLLSLVQK